MEQLTFTHKWWNTQKWYVVKRRIPYLKYNSWFLTAQSSNLTRLHINSVQIKLHFVIHLTRRKVECGGCWPPKYIIQSMENKITTNALDRLLKRLNPTKIWFATTIRTIDRSTWDHMQHRKWEFNSGSGWRLQSKLSGLLQGNYQRVYLLVSFHMFSAFVFVKVLVKLIKFRKASVEESFPRKWIWRQSQMHTCTRIWPGVIQLTKQRSSSGNIVILREGGEGVNYR